MMLGHPISTFFFPLPCLETDTVPFQHRRVKLRKNVEKKPNMRLKMQK